MTEDDYSYVIRAKRAELANWGIMGTAQGLEETMLFSEFRATDYFHLEFTRIDGVQHFSLDGEDLESWDEGHMAIDLQLGRAVKLSRHGAPVMGDLEKAAFMDQRRVAGRSFVTHFLPDGNYWMPWFPERDENKITLYGKTFARNFIPTVFDEPVVRARVDAVCDFEKIHHNEPMSDIQPYGALYILRDG